MGLAAVKTFSLAFSSTLAELYASLEAEGVILEHCRGVLASTRSQALALERAHEHSLQDGALIVSLRQQLAACEGGAEALRVREALAREELARERAALHAASVRIAELAAEGEALRQTLAAAPRPARPQLLLRGAQGRGAAHGAPAAAPPPPAACITSPFEQWRAGRDLARKDGGSSSAAPAAPRGAALTAKQRRSLGHACASGSGEAGSGSGGEEAGGAADSCGAAAPLGRGALALVEHAFWSPHLYAPCGGPAPAPAAAPPPTGAPPPAALLPPPTPPPPRLLRPFTLVHISNLARNGGATDAWGEELEAERARLTSTLLAVKGREARIAALSGKGGGE